MNKIECPSCAMEVDSKSRECPICGYEFPKTKNTFVIIAVILIIVFVLLYIF